MLPADRVGDRVWEDDVNDIADYVESMTLTLNDLYARAEYQGAAPELVARLRRIRDLTAEALDELHVVAPFFPKAL